MRLVPENAAAKVRFFEHYVSHWTANDVGLDAEQLDALAQQTAEARAALDAQVAARAAAQAATLQAKLAVAAMARTGAAAIGTVRARAKTDGPSVFIVASIPAPRSTNATLGPPGTPTRFAVTLNPMGTITLTWRCRHPQGVQGTLYSVHRRIGDGAFESLGIARKRRFVDATLPAGTASATYRIQAFRSTTSGQSADFPVNLGVDPARAAMLATRFRPAA